MLNLGREGESPSVCPDNPRREGEGKPGSPPSGFTRHRLLEFQSRRLTAVTLGVPSGVSLGVPFALSLSVPYALSLSVPIPCGSALQTTTAFPPRLAALPAHRASCTPAGDETRRRRPMATADESGLCPNCDAEGIVGDPCTERGCRKRGYHHIPKPYADKLASSQHATMEPVIGRKVGDYLAVDVIGQGGFGKVYLALQMPILMETALKLMDRTDIDNDKLAATLLTKFEGEAQALAKLFHPNIVRLLKYGAHAGIPFLVMEYVKGGRTLKKVTTDLAQTGDRFEPSVIRHVLRQVVDALDAAHQLKIVHRDIKPENIMLQAVAGNDQLVRILDFGLAKFVAERQETSMAMGTPVYMAPEQWTRKNIGPWTDLYAVGVLAFELLTGRKPYPGRTNQEVMAQKLDPAYDPTFQIKDLRAPNAVFLFLRRSLARDPENRYRTAEEFRSALNEMVDEVEKAAEFGGTLSTTIVLQGDEPVNEADLHIQQTLALEGGGFLAKEPVPMATGRTDSASGTGSSQQDVEVDEHAVKSRMLWPLVVAAAVVLATIGVLIGTSGSEDRAGQVTQERAERGRASLMKAGSTGSPKKPAEPRITPTARASSTAPSPVDSKPAGDRKSTERGTSVSEDSSASSVVEPVETKKEEAAAVTLEAATRAGVPPATRKARVESTPRRASVFAGDEEIGRTPLDVTWPEAETLLISLKHRGYVPTELTLKDEDDGKTTKVALKKKRAAKPKKPKTTKPKYEYK